MKPIYFLVLATFLSLPAFGENISISERQKVSMKTVEIVAETEKGISVVLKKEIVRKDCNRIQFVATAFRIDDMDVNWWAQYFIATRFGSSEMGCPLPKPVSETITSNPMIFDSHSPNGAAPQVSVYLTLPSDVQVLVSEIK